MADEPAQPPTSEAPPAPRRRLRARHFAFSFAGYALSLLAVLALLGGALWWLVGTDRGSAWLIDHLPGVQATGVQGNLRSDMQIASLAIDLPGDGASLRIDDLAWRGLRIGTGLGSNWLRVRLQELRAASVHLRLGESTDSEPLQPPADLRMPLRLDIDSIRIGELHIDSLGEQPLRELRAGLHVGTQGGALHRIDDLHFAWDRLQVQARAQVGSGGEMPMQVELQAQQQFADSGEWQAQASLAGALAAPQLEVQLRARTQADTAEQSLDASAQLHPFARWPLGTLTARARALDLSALSSSAPATALDIDASAKTDGMDQPADVALTMHNVRPGRWNEGRLPLRSADLHLQARPDAPDRFELKVLDAVLSGTAGSAGRLRGSGEWHAGQWSLDMRIDALQPQSLDTRAPAMTLQGQLRLDGSDFDAQTLDQAAIEVRGELQGRQFVASGTAADNTVQLRLDARLGLLQIELRNILARAGDASATLSGRLTRATTSAAWHAQGRLGLRDFDPSDWWAGTADSPWRRGPHRLNANADFALQLPAALAGNASVMQTLAALRGTASLSVDDSRLAGVPISAALALQATARAPLQASLRLDADGNHLQATARLDANSAGSGDQWSVRADMPALQRLTPLWRLLDPDGKLGGALKVEASADGRWPGLITKGHLQASTLQADDTSVQQASAKWQLGSRAGDVFGASVELKQLRQGPASADSVALRLDGTARQHRLDLRIGSKSLPPSWFETLRAAPGGVAAKHTLAKLQLQGGFSAAADGTPTGWRGKLQQLDVRGDAVGAPPWIAVDDVPFEVRWAGAQEGTALQLQVGSGRADLLGAVLSFGPISWQGAQADGQAARLQAQAELEPLPVAPLLARLQPGFGWGGDLRLRGHLAVRSTPQFSAEMVLERASGDLQVTDDAGTRALGFTDLRVALQADEGVWNFSAGVAGTALGSAAGALVVQASPRSLWPAGGAPLQGVLEMHVANLGIWGPWLPAGWRVSGAMHVGANIAGKFGAPTLTGDITGSGVGVRNVLQGVDVRDGEVRIALQGDTARIERFTAHAGAGELRLTGEASLGATPRADLQLLLDHFQLLGRVDRRIVTSGQARLSLGADSLALDGELKVDEGLIDFSRSDAPQLSSDVQVVRASERNQADAAAASGEAAADEGRKISLNLRVLLGEKLRIRGHGLDAELRGDLRLTMPKGRLRVDGTVRTVNGTYRAYRQNLVIDRGVLTFNGPVDNPQLDIEATRPNLDVRVGVAVTGTVLVPRIRLFSDPPMSDVDKLSWLLRGRASEGEGSADTAMLQAAALALASGDQPGAFDRIMNTIGLDEFSVREGSGTSTGAIVSVGRQLSRNWYIGYERGLNAAAGNWQLIYRVAQRFTIRAQGGLENSIALIWTWRWQ